MKALSTLPSATSDVAKSRISGGTPVSPSPAPGNAHGEGSRREALLTRAERGDENAAAHIHAVNRDETLGGCALGPLADAPDMAGTAQRRDGHPVRAGAGNTQIDDAPPEGLAHAVPTIGNDEDAAVIDDLEVAPEPQGALVDPGEIFRHTHHAVAVMPGEIGAHQRGGDVPGLGFLRSPWHETAPRPALSGHRHQCVPSDDLPKCAGARHLSA